MRRLSLAIPDEMYADCIAQLKAIALASGSTLEHAATLTFLLGQMYQRLNSEEDGIEMTYYDQFGKPIESDRTYGIGRTPTKCIPHETKYDSEIDEIVIRRRGSTGSFERLYQDGANMHTEGTFFFLLDEELSPYTEEPRETSSDPALATFLNDQLSGIVIDQNKQLVREKLICHRLGIRIDDGSDLADMVTRFVRDPDSTTVSELVAAAAQQTQTA